jgi:hypothetical protein
MPETLPRPSPFTRTPFLLKRTRQVSGPKSSATARHEIDQQEKFISFFKVGVLSGVMAGKDSASLDTGAGSSASAKRTAWVTLVESQAPPVVRAGLLQSTLIVLPVEEKVANVFAGDMVDWVFDGGHVASRFISVKPKTANSSTDIHIVSDHGNEYTLELREISSDPDGHYDSKVLIEPGDKAAKEKLAQLPVFVPAAELDKAKQDAAAAQAAEAATLKAEKTKEETYRSEYPGSLHFD